MQSLECITDSSKANTPRHLAGFSTVLEATREQIDWDRWPDSKAVFYHFGRHTGGST